MKKAINVVVFCLLVMGSMAQIQRKVAPKPATDSLAPAPATGDEAGKRRDMLKELNLDKQQKSKLKNMRQAAKQEKEAIEGDAKLTDEQKKQRLQELRKRQMAKMDSVLTPEQKQQMLQMRRDAMKEKRAGKRVLKNEAVDTEMKQEE